MWCKRCEFFSLAGNGRTDGQTDRRTYTVIIVNNWGSRNLLRLRSHCRAIGYEHHNWPFVDDRGISAWIPVRSDAGRYVRTGFVAIEYDMLTIGQFPDISFRCKQDCPDRVHDLVPI